MDIYDLKVKEQSLLTTLSANQAKLNGARARLETLEDYRTYAYQAYRYAFEFNHTIKRIKTDQWRGNAAQQFNSMFQEEGRITDRARVLEDQCLQLLQNLNVRINEQHTNMATFRKAIASNQAQINKVRSQIRKAV